METAVSPFMMQSSSWGHMAAEHKGACRGNASSPVWGDIPCISPKIAGFTGIRTEPLGHEPHALNHCNKMQRDTMDVRPNLPVAYVVTLMSQSWLGLLMLQN